jgi:DNA-binding NtrC family response regulator
MLTAMVVDDEPFHRDLLEVFLNTMGFSIVWAVGTPSEAKQKYREAVPKPAVIIIDHHLGMADGLHLLSDLMKIDETVRVIFMSSDPESERDCYKIGAKEFVRKPYAIAEIGKAVNRAMRPGVVS